jgi:hypothetical protein
LDDRHRAQLGGVGLARPRFPAILNRLSLPVAHVGHYLWTLYVIPILIVVGAIVRNTVAQRRVAREDSEEEGR